MTVDGKGVTNGVTWWAWCLDRRSVALAVHLGLWMMVRGYGLAFVDWVGGLPVTVQLPQKGMRLGSVYLPQYPDP
jgi:hypothetical protein